MGTIIKIFTKPFQIVPLNFSAFFEARNEIITIWSRREIFLIISRLYSIRYLKFLGYLICILSNF